MPGYVRRLSNNGRRRTTLDSGEAGALLAIR
jgi:hypothetical protein